MIFGQEVIQGRAAALHEVRVYVFNVIMFK
jgi:hypothetical protein